MTFLYSCRHSGDQYRITKMDAYANIESSYLCTATECECPAGHRPSCRHRDMLPKFIHRGHVGDDWLWDHDRGGWVQGAGVELTAQPLLVQSEQSLTGDNFIDAVFGEPSTFDILAPEGLGQASEPEPSPQSHSQMVMTTDFDSVGEGSSPSVTANTPSPSPTIRRRV